MERTVSVLNLIHDSTSVSVKGNRLHCLITEAASFTLWAGMTSKLGVWLKEIDLRQLKKSTGIKE